MPVCNPAWELWSAQTTALCMLSMDPQCTHILHLFSAKNGCKWDLLTMFFCSFLSRMDAKNSMVRNVRQTWDKSHRSHTNVSVTSEDVCFCPPRVFIKACWFRLMLFVIEERKQDKNMSESVSLCLWAHPVAVQLRFSPSSSINDYFFPPVTACCLTCFSVI